MNIRTVFGLGPIESNKSIGCFLPYPAVGHARGADCCFRRQGQSFNVYDAEDALLFRAMIAMVREQERRLE
jgi:hypothetical protein